MADSNSNNSNFLRIVYTKVKTNGQTELIPLKLYSEVPVEEITLPAMMTTEAAIPLGTLISNRYLIQKVLGQGGFGRTYLASDRHCFNKSCVLKEFLPGLIAESYVEQSRNLFRREARILYQFDHLQIPKFLTCFEESGRMFLVQEYVEGKTYSMLLKERLSQQKRAFCEAEVIQWLKNLLPVIEYIQQHNIIHRDISPDNVILNSDKNLPVSRTT
jgi:serine/threonine-protein kinase